MKVKNSRYKTDSQDLIYLKFYGFYVLQKICTVSKEQKMYSNTRKKKVGLKFLAQLRKGGQKLTKNIQKAPEICQGFVGSKIDHKVALLKKQSKTSVPLYYRKCLLVQIEKLHNMLITNCLHLKVFTSFSQNLSQ